VIRRARREDLPLLMELWEASFGDSRAYISFFFENRFSPRETFFYEEEGRPVSMLFLLNATVQCAQGHYAARYLYAACTEQAYRGRGLMRSLIDFAALAAAEEGADCIALVPASQSLFRYYADCGFQNAFYCETVRLSRQEAEEIASGTSGFSGPLTAQEMAEIRRNALQNRDHLIWDDGAVRYALEEHLFTGGNALCVKTAEAGEGYCLYQQQENACIVQELLASERAVLPHLFSALTGACDAWEFSLRCPAGLLPLSNRAEKNAYGMLRPISRRAAQLPLTLQNAYLGLSLG